MATRPQTIGYSLLDSPVGLAAWLLDHDTDSYHKISCAFVDGEPVGNLTQETIVDNVTLYWLTGTAASAARSYWEDGRALAAALASGQAPPAVTVPVGFTTFPGEIWGCPASWVEEAYLDLAYFNEVDRRPLRRGRTRSVAASNFGPCPPAAIVQEGDRVRELAVSLANCMTADLVPQSHRPTRFGARDDPGEVAARRC